MAGVQLRNLTKRFGGTVAVDRVNLKVMDGEFMVLLGPSGCGKSTILRLIAGLEEPDEGEIWIGDRLVNDVDPAKRNVAMVFQNYALYPHMSVYHNIEFPLRMSGVSKSERRRRVVEVARFLEIEGLLDKMPKQLSGGQQQRVALARAIVREPQVFLLDEPLSNLDAKLRVRMRFELRRLLKERLGITTIYVTHDQAEAMTMADRITVLNKGRVQQVGTPVEVFESPSNTFVAGFIGVPPMNMIEGTLVVTDEGPAIDTGSLKILVPPAAMEYPRVAGRLGKTLLIGIRPQHIRVSQYKKPGFYRATLLGIEHLGTEIHVHITTNGKDEITAIAEDAINSDMVYWKPDISKIYIFEPSGERIYP